MRKLIMSVLCMSVICFIACKSTDRSDSSLEEIQTATFTSLMNISCNNEHECDIKYDDKAYEAVYVDKYIACAGSIDVCNEQAKKSNLDPLAIALVSENGFRVGKEIPLTNDREKVKAGNGASCLYLMAIRNASTAKSHDRPKGEIKAFNMPGQRCIGVGDVEEFDPEK